MAVARGAVGATGDAGVAVARGWWGLRGWWGPRVDTAGAQHADSKARHGTPPRHRTEEWLTTEQSAVPTNEQWSGWTRQAGRSTDRGEYIQFIPDYLL